MVYFLVGVLFHFFCPLQAVPPVPDQWVNDYTQTLSQAEISSLEQYLRAYEDSTHLQIAVVLINGIEQDIATYATTLGRAWGIGNQDNKGILVLIFKDKRQIFIAPGYGLEGVLPDAIISRIIREHFIPYAKQAKFYEGIAQTLIALQNTLKDEKSEAKDAQKTSATPFIGLVIFLLIILFFIWRGSKRDGGGNGNGGWMLAAPLMLGSMRGGGGFGGGNSGGGFGGFGGGSFGGGGAGGNW